MRTRLSDPSPSHVSHAVNAGFDKLIREAAIEKQTAITHTIKSRQYKRQMSIINVYIDRKKNTNVK